MSNKPVSSNEHVDRWLFRFGHSTVEDMQGFYGLAVDGVCSQTTLEAMNRPRCGVQDFRVAGANARWSRTDLCYWNGTGGFSLFHYEMSRTKSAGLSAQLIDDGFLRWAEVLPGFKFGRTRDARHCDMWLGGGRGRAHEFDGPGHVLAWAYMPLGDDGRLESRFDMDERFTHAMSKRKQEPWVLARAVWLHEAGHLLGLDHSRNPGDLMAPYYNPDVTDLQPGDIARIRKLYGIGT